MQAGMCANVGDLKKNPVFHQTRSEHTLLLS